MTASELISAFWAAMRANDWNAAAECLAPQCVVDWPCSGERIVGRSDFATLQARYPTNTGRWSFEVHRLVAEGDTVVSEVTVSDGEQAARGLLRDRGWPRRASGRVLAHRLRPPPLAGGPHAVGGAHPLKPA